MRTDPCEYNVWVKNGDLHSVYLLTLPSPIWDPKAARTEAHKRGFIVTSVTVPQHDFRRPLPDQAP